MQIQLKYWASSFVLGEGRENIRIILGDHRNDDRTAEAYRLILLVHPGARKIVKILRILIRIIRQTLPPASTCFTDASTQAKNFSIEWDDTTE